MKNLIVTLMVLIFANTAFAGAHFCASEVKDKAAKLFALHNDLDLSKDTFGLSDDISVQAPIRSPDGKRRYSVLETTAVMGKMGEYRIRMIFAVLGKTDPKKDCILMGQEILDLSSL